MSGGREVANLFPLERIKADMPEFCSLVALARFMSADDDNNLSLVKHNIGRIIEILLSVPTESILPSNKQKAGLEGLLYLTESVSESYANELDKHTQRMLDSIKAFNQTVTEIERVKNEVVKKYATSISQFEEIVELSQTSSIETTQTLKDLLVQVIDEQQEIENENEMKTTEESREVQPIPIKVEEEEKTVTTTTSKEESPEFLDFFQANNESAADEKTEATTTGTPIISIDLKMEKKEEQKEQKEEKEEPKQEEKKTETATTTRRSRRKRTTR